MGESRLNSTDRATPLPEFLAQYTGHSGLPRIPGTAVFTTPRSDMVPPYLPASMFEHGIIYEKNVLVSVVILDEPRGLSWTPLKELADGLHQFEIRVGYMEKTPDLRACVYADNLDPRAVFYGMVRIAPIARRWIPYSILKRVSPIYTSHYHISLPELKTHGVIDRVDMG